MLRGLAAFAGVVTLAATAHAWTPRSGPRPAADTLTAMPAAGVSKPLRVQATVRYGRATSPAWAKLAALGSWEASWDAATGVPSRIWGSGIPAPGATNDPAIAERVARQLLAEHIALIAPGSSPADFVLVSNHFDGDMRSIGFFQYAGGRRVVGGQVSFRIKHDRVFVIGSEALPDVHVAVPRARMAARALRDRAVTSLRTDLALPDAPVTDAGDEVILPLVGDDAVLGYRLVRPLTIDGGAQGRYLAYADATSGAVIAIHQQNHFATGTMLYHGVDRYPGRGRIDRVAPRVHVTVGGAPQTSSPAGVLMWSPDVAQTVQTAVVGDLVAIVNKATSGALATTTLPLAPGGTALWDASAVAEDDAQVNVYLNINIVKEWVRANIDANMPTLDDAITANTNIAMDCNAFFDGKAVNFFHSTTMCENTGLIQDVVFHEFGHDVHTQEIIMGVGSFDGAMSEGAADFLAASVTGDHGMGRGFFYTDTPLRDLDPPDMEYAWPADIGEIHHTGLIFGGTFWDLRTSLITAFGETEGVALVEKIYVGALRRSINIPTSLIESLAADDDDGDLSNGTPHECFIRDAFGRHGLRTATGTISAPGSVASQVPDIGVVLSLQNLNTRCSGDAIGSVTVKWQPGYGGVPEAGQYAAADLGGSRYYAQIPLGSNDDVYYQGLVGFADGTTLVIPDNLGDPFYQLYQGATVPLYCTSFDTDPFTEGWTTGTGDDTPSPWVWGVPGGGATDPPAAFTGTHVLAQVLGGDYTASSYSYVKLPPIDVGNYSDVRLQYRRWLGVEDSHYDKARVTTNGHQAWINFTANMGDSSSTHTIDREWRFHDVPLSGFFSGRSLEVAFDLRSDEGLQLGGWQIDDLCIVANPLSICGDGVKAATEQCDNGVANADVADVCRTTCRLPTCGDGIVDSNEECDGGEGGDEGCSPDCKSLTLGGSGCCSANAGPGGPLLLAGLVLGAVLRRRRISTRR